MNKTTISALLFAGLCASGASAQDNIIPPARLGIFGGANINLFSPDIQAWRGTIPQDTAFVGFTNVAERIVDGSSTLGLNLGIMGGVPLSRTIHLSGRIGYNNLSGSGELVQTNPTTTVTNVADISYSTLEVSPVVEFYNLIPGVNIHPLVGLEFGFPLGASITQTASFQQQNRTGSAPIATDADIPSASVRAAFIVGLGYTFRIDTSNWYIQPEISYRAALTKLSSDAAFNPSSVSQIRLGVNIFWGFGSKNQTSSAQSSDVSVRMDRITTSVGGADVDVSSLNLEDVQYNEMFPLVPYVFMPENGATPEASYQASGVPAESGQFIPESLPLDAIEINRNLLNVIGARMRKYEQASLTITGTTDGKTEAKTPGLAKARAEWAKNFLTTNFAIDPNRIVTKTTATPAKPSSVTTPDGIVENRRVEFESNVPDVLAPIVIKADNSRISTPMNLQFQPKIVAEDSIRDWDMSLVQAGKPLQTMSGTGKPKRISWNVKPNELSAAQVPVDYELTIRTTEGDSAITTGSLPVDYVSSVRKRTTNESDKTIDKYSLILFDFDKSELNAENKRILEQSVLPSIRANSTVRIVGYSDRIGNDDYNATLSKERALTVEAFLKQTAKDAKFVVSGVGESHEPYDNNSTIGRQLSRTVQVTVETPRR